MGVGGRHFRDKDDFVSVSKVSITNRPIRLHKNTEYIMAERIH